MNCRRDSFDRVSYNALSPRYAMQHEVLKHLMLTQPRYMQPGSRHKTKFYDI